VYDLIMTLPHALVLLGILISILGYYAYIRDTLRGETKPNRVSWLMWSIAPLVATGAALSAGGDPWSTVSIFLMGFLPLLVLVSSFFQKKSEWKLGLFDALCGIFSMIALAFWLGVDSPKIALLFAAIGDFFAYIPTIKKAWTHPETETGFTYSTGIITIVLILFSVPEWTIENYGFQLYLIVANSMLLFCIYRKKLLCYLDV
jgi:hypothetical protein